MSDLSILKNLIAYFFPGVADEDSDPGVPTDTPDDLPPDTDDATAQPAADEFDLDDGTTPEDDPDEDAPPQGQEGARTPSRAQARIQRQAAELRATKERLAALEARLQNPPAPQATPPVDPDLARLNDPDLDPMERFRIEGNLAIRQTNLMAQRALEESRNIADQTKFAMLVQTQPILKKYEARVEQEVAKMRAQGQQVPPREAIADYLMGKDLREGRLKPRSSSTKSGTAQAPRVANNGRGQPVGARSDVPASRGMTNLQKLEKRLEGKPI